MTYNHGIQIIVFPYTTPIHTLAQLLFQNQVQPNAGASSVAFHKRMCHIHFYVFIYNLIECILRHALYHLQGIVQILCQTEGEIPFANGFGTNLSGKVI